MALRRFGALFLVAVFLLQGCGKRESSDVKIGALIPLTGSSAEYGKWMKDALEMARQEINEAGGINGKELSIIYEDEAGDPKTAASAMQKLADVDKVPIVFGAFNSGCVLAQAPVAERTKTPILAEAQAPQIRDAGDYVFRIQPDSRLYIKYFVPYVFNNLDIHKVAILYVNNAFGKALAEIFADSLQKLGGKIVYEGSFQQGATDFRTQLIKIKQLKPEGVFVPAVGETGYVLKQAYELGVSAQFLGGSPTESPDVLLEAGKGAEGVIYCHHFDPDSKDSAVTRFVKNYERLYGRVPEGYAALAYDGLKVIAKVLRECGPNRDAIKDSLYKVQNFPGVTGLTSFDDHGDVIKPIYIKTIKDGKFITIWKSY
jgi:branched-chain amino acid transport system substrate-binding protein